MTMTEPDVAQATLAQHPETVPTIPTRDQVIEAIIAQTGCTSWTADTMLNFLEGSVKMVRSQGYDFVGYLSTSAIDTFHAVMEMVMPDEVTAPEPGTAHDLINRHLLDPELGELSLVHTKGGPTASWCGTKVQVRTAA